MGANANAQRLIAVSLGKIAMSRQQRGGINLHKNLLVASVLHKARTTYMMDNFQTLLANKRAQAEKEAAAKMIIETPSAHIVDNRQCESMDESVQARGVTDCNATYNAEVPSGERPVNDRLAHNAADKENVVPVSHNNISDNVEYSENKKSCVRDSNDLSAPIVTGKVPLGLSDNNGSNDYVRQLSSCRCVGTNKRRRSFVDSDVVTQPKKPRYEDDCGNSDSENEYETKEHGRESMHTEQSLTQVTNLVDIFNSGFNGLYKDNETGSTNSGPGHINVYVSADRSISGHQYVLTDLSCATQVKGQDNVSIQNAIALAV